MKLSQRLQCVVDFIEDGSSVFDIGADHGALEIFLSKERQLNKIVAVDNKVGPYNVLKKNTDGLNNVITKLSSGLDDYDSDCDTVVMAGMGGLLIVNLIKEHLEFLNAINRFVIDAHRDIPAVRKELTSLGYNIKSEKIVKENNHYYIVILFEKGSFINYKEEEILYGVNIQNDPLYAEYSEFINKRIQSIEEKRGNNNEHN